MYKKLTGSSYSATMKTAAKLSNVFMPHFFIVCPISFIVHANNCRFGNSPFYPLSPAQRSMNLRMSISRKLIGKSQNTWSYQSTLSSTAPYRQKRNGRLGATQNVLCNYKNDGMCNSMKWNHCFQWQSFCSVWYSVFNFTWLLNYQFCVSFDAIHTEFVCFVFLYLQFNCFSVCLNLDCGLYASNEVISFTWLIDWIPVDTRKTFSNEF